MTTWILCHQLKKGKLELPYNFGRLNQAHSVDSHAFGSRSRRCSTATFLMTYTCSSWGWQAEGFCSLNKMFSWQEKKRDKMNSSIAKGAEVVERLLSQLQLWQRCSFLPQPWGLTLPPILLLAQESRERCRAKCNHAVLPWKEFFPRKHMHDHLPWLHTAAQQRLCHQHCWTVPHSAWPSSLRAEAHQKSLSRMPHSGQLFTFWCLSCISCPQPEFSTPSPQNNHLQVSCDQNWQHVLRCQQVLLQAWKAKSSPEGTEEVLSRGPSSEGFSFTSQRFPLRL